MEEIRAIRRKLHDAETHLSSNERVQRINRAAQRFLKQHHLEGRWVPATRVVLDA